ncbi:MAG: protease complex subunit PrcB family protein [Bernardetiaceae bacterium]|nr:protease complex subunit PrcB family protein [Bernardetiaceae bacterium]
MRILSGLLVFFMLGFGAISCKSSKQTSGTEQTREERRADIKVLDFTTKMRGKTGGPATGGNYSIQSRANLSFTNMNPLPENLKGIDFDNQTLIFVASGPKNMEGYDVEITRITESQFKVIVYYTESAPSNNVSGTEASLSPFHAVTIPKTTKTIEFVKQ